MSLDRWYLWLPFAFVSGFAIFDFTVLLHEVVHRAVLSGKSEGAYRFIGILYAVPSGISSTQFTRWHLDHHSALGSDLEDPKRHYLSPKINERWFKLLYFTPALFPIYFRAATARGGVVRAGVAEDDQPRAKPDDRVSSHSRARSSSIHSAG